MFGIYSCGNFGVVSLNGNGLVKQYPKVRVVFVSSPIASCGTNPSVFKHLEKLEKTKLFSAP